MKRTPLLVSLLTLCSLNLSAQTAKGARVVHTQERSSNHVSWQDIPESLTTIYNNLGTKTNAYLDTDGWSITGFNSFGGSGSAFSVALPFTPKSNSHVSQVRVAVQYDGLGANQVNLSIYGDAAGIPGTLLAGPVTVTNLSVFGTCCTLAIANFTPVAVTAGSQYWVVAGAPLSGQGSDFVGVWDWVSKQIIFGGTNGVNGWSAINVDGLPAGKVLGTVP